MLLRRNRLRLRRGPNHILPTNGTAFASALGVDDFVKRSNIIAYTEAALAQLGPVAVRLADIEGLGAHARPYGAGC